MDDKKFSTEDKIELNEVQVKDKKGNWDYNIR